MTASTLRGSELGALVSVPAMARPAARPSVERRSWSAPAPFRREESGGRMTHESLRGAPTKIPIRLVEVLRIATGAAIASCTVCRAAGGTLVTARPAPVPVNSTFTVVADADVAGPSLGTDRGEGRVGPRVRLTPCGATSRFESLDMALPKNFENGAIH